MNMHHTLGHHVSTLHEPIVVMKTIPANLL